MYAWEAIEQSLTFTEEHLTREVYTGELASIVGPSPFYFQHLFKRLVSKPVQEYMKLRRLAKVIEDVDSIEQRIPDVAPDYGFTDHAGFTRAFKEMYRTTPEEYRRGSPMLNVFDRPEVSMSYVLVDEGVSLVVGNIILEIQRKTLVEPEVYLGLETEVRVFEQIPVGENTDVDVPGQLQKRYHMEKASIIASINTDVEVGMPHIWDIAQGLFAYFTGGLIQSIPHHQQGYLVKERLAAGDYIVCRIGVENFEDSVTDALNQGRKYLFGTWLSHHNSATKPFSVRKYYCGLKDMACMEVWVKLLPSEDKRQEGEVDWNMLYTAGDLYTERSS